MKRKILLVDYVSTSQHFRNLFWHYCDHHQPLGAILICSSCFQYRCKSFSDTFSAFSSSSPNGCSVSSFACVLTARSATWGFDGSDGITGACWGSATSFDGFSGTTEVVDSRVLAFCDAGVGAEGLVTLAVEPKERVDWPVLLPVRRRVGGILLLNWRKTVQISLVSFNMDSNLCSDIWERELKFAGCDCGEHRCHSRGCAGNRIYSEQNTECTPYT